MNKILEVFGEPIICGGQEAFVNNVIENIDWDGLKIDLYTPYYCDNDVYKNNIESRGGRVFAAGLEFNPGGSRFNIKKTLNELLENEKYDIVHVHSGSVSVLSIVAQIAKRNKVNNIIVHSHSPAEHETLKHILVKIWFFKTMITCPTCYMACSLNAAMCKFPKYIAVHKTRFVKNGINLQKYTFNEKKRKIIRDSLNLDEKDYLIGHVGRFSKEKNHKFLIEMIEKLVAYDKKFKLLLIGDGELKEKIEIFVKNKHLNDYVFFTGSVDNVHEYMQAMDCFALPSLYEGLPFVGVEAQASGMPIIVSTGVSIELKLTNSIVYEELDVDKWICKIKSFCELKRVNNIAQLKKSGFDIVETAAILRKLYLDGV